MKVLNIFQKKESSLDFESLFIIIANGVVLAGWLALILMTAQIFFKPLIMAGLALITLLTYFHLASYQSIQKPTKKKLAVFLFIVFFAVFIAAFAHESFLCGRDEGEYANWAYYLSQQGTYRLKDAQTPRELLTALVRPGITQPDFDFGYIAWLALHGAFWGIEGIKIGNFLPLIVGLLSLYFIGKKIGSERVGIFTILMLSTSFVLIWYSRQTMAETYSLALIWLGILSFLKAYQENKSNFLIFSFLSLGLFLFTRPEGIWIFTMLLAATAFFYLSREKISKKPLFVLPVILLLFFSYSVLIQPTYFKAIPLGLKTFIGAPIKRIVSLVTKTYKAPLEEEIGYVAMNSALYILNVLGTYNMLLPLLLASAVILKAVFKREGKNFLILIIGSLIAPTFVFLFRLTLFQDQPWMLRRYLYTILPFSYLLTAVFLQKFAGRFKCMLLFLLLSVNLLISAPILTFAQFDGIVSGQIKEIAEVLPDEAVILCESSALGFRAPLRFVFGKKTIFTYASEVNHFLNEAASQPVYIVAPEEGAMLSYLPDGAAEEIKEQIVRYQVLENIGHIYHPTAFQAKHKIFQKVPKKIINLAASLKVCKINDSYKGFMPNEVVVYPGEKWHFDKSGLKLRKKSVSSLLLFFSDSQKLKMQIKGTPSQMCLEGKQKCNPIEIKPDYQGWITIGFKEEEVERRFERVNLVITSGREDFLIKKMMVE